ncbi:MAG: tandem-95 repeat protein, partial [Rhizobiaceae bacterium]|nr:tandem-95 repeat protein [Rhizobiaceae bacterium]
MNHLVSRPSRYTESHLLVRLFLLTLAFVVAFFAVTNMAFAQTPPEGDRQPTITVLEDAAPFNFSIFGTDADGFVASFRIQSLPDPATEGTFYTDVGLTQDIAVGDVIGTTGVNELTLYFEPATDFAGTVFLWYFAIDNDGLEAVDRERQRIDLTAVNDAPVGVGDSYSTDVNTALSGQNVVINDEDVDTLAASLTASLVTDVTDGTLSLSTNGDFTYTPDTDFIGTDSFEYKINDGEFDSNTVTVTITVNATNTAPIAVNDSVTTDEDVVANFDVRDNDTDAESSSSSLDASVVTGPSNGGVVLELDGTFTYTPNSNFNGSDSFTYQVNDGEFDSNIATVNITVNAIN